MTTSYKTLWQEARQEADQLKATIEGMRQRHRAEMDRVHAFISASRTALADTRQIVDLAGIARHMHVERFTPQQWQQRELLPPVDFPEIKGVPLWYASTIREKFALPTGRAWYDSPEAEPEQAEAA